MNDERNEHTENDTSNRPLTTTSRKKKRLSKKKKKKKKNLAELQRSRSAQVGEGNGI
jgi:hypothetical protein